MTRQHRTAGALAATLLIAAAGASPSLAGQQTPENLEGLYRGGVAFDQFLESADERREGWLRNYENGDPSEMALERARGIGAPARLLVVAEDWCGDSVNTIPYLARLVEAVQGLEMRIINSDIGADLMRHRPTPDGRPATPTVIALDSDYREIGSWVERPGSLQEWFLANEDELPRQELYGRKYAWYAEDAGSETVSDITALLERAFGVAAEQETSRR